MKILSLALVVSLLSTLSSGCKKEEIIAGTAAAGSIIGGLGEFFGFFRDVVTPVAGVAVDEDSGYVEKTETPEIAKAEEKNNTEDFPELKYPEESAAEKIQPKTADEKILPETTDEKTPPEKNVENNVVNTVVKIEPPENDSTAKITNGEPMATMISSSDTKNAELSKSNEKNAPSPTVPNPPEKISSEPTNEEPNGRAYLGIRIDEKTYKGEIYPMIVEFDNDVESSPMSKAGVELYSIVLSVNGQAVHSVEEFKAEIAKIKFGKKIKIEYVPNTGNKEPKTVEVEPKYTRNIAGNEYLRRKDSRYGYSFDSSLNMEFNTGTLVYISPSATPKTSAYLNNSKFEIFVIENEGKSHRAKYFEELKAKEHIKNLKLEELNASTFAAQWINTSERRDIIEKDFFVVDHYDKHWTYIVRYTYDDKTADSDKAIARHMIESFQPPTFK